MTRADTDDRRWNAVLARSAADDGRFLYAVRTTGIYCRPSCPSRRPQRANVLFFGSADEARSAGFRACLRCAPDAGTPRDERIERLCRMIERADEPPTLASLAAAAALSRFHLQREFKRVVGLTPAAYYRWVRSRRLSRSLSRREPVDDAIYAAGYGSPSRVYERAGELLGMTPAAFRKGGAGQALRYAFADTPFGLMLVAATARGICAIEFGASRAELVALLERRFPRAERQPAGRAMDAWVAAVVRHVGNPARPLRLPLDVQGTVFQKQVWDALGRVRAGATISYGELARELGRPQAVRAVAAACAANPVAVAIPCHRAVGGDGALRGYRWGIERKRALLAHEKKLASRRTR